MQDNLENIYELTPLQQGLLIETLSKPDSDAYTIQFILTLDAAKLDETAFRQAWQTVLDRHAVLRSAFYWQDLDKPVQVALREVDLPWQVLDWRHHERLEAEWTQWQLADLQQPFVLEDAPLFRCTLIRVDAASTRFVWTVHHLINDGWSYPILLNEMLAFYQAVTQGQTLSLPLPPPFVDYIDWLQQQDMAQAERFWRGQLAGFNTPTSLGISKSTPQGQSDYQTRQVLLSAEQTESLQQFAQQHRLTLNTLLQGTWALLLARYSNTDDVVFGGSVSGRPATLPGVESMVGMFTNTLPVRVRVDTNTRLLPWLQTLQQQQVEQEQYAYCSLVDIQGWSDVPRGSPLFESIFAYENYPLEARWEQLGLIRDMQAVERVPYPLSFVAMLRGVMELHVQFDSRRYAVEKMSRLLAHFQTLLMNMVAQPQANLTALTMLTPSEQQQLQAWNDTCTDYPRDQTIVSLFEGQVERTPDNTAVVFGDNSVTYAELNARANRLAYALIDQGIKADSLVGICVERSLEMVIGLLAILKAGGAYMPLDPVYPTERLAFMLKDSQIPVLLTQAHLQGGLPLADINPQPRLVCIDDTAALVSQPDTNPVARSLPQHLAYAIYTSGSTGKPKGALVQHDSLVNLVNWHQRNFAVTSQDRASQFANFAFDAATWEIWPYLCAGVSLYLIPPKLPLNPANICEWLQTNQITIAFLPTPVTEALLSSSYASHASLRVLLTGGDQLKLYPDTALPFQVVNNYGPTENTVVSTSGMIAGDAQAALSASLPAIGSPIANTCVYILDSHLQPLPPGIPGELCVAGAGLARGYLNRPELTAEKFVTVELFAKPERIYRTGDLARWLPDGSLEYLGRIDQQVKLRGFRIELGEIEAVLAQHPDVSAAAVALHEREGNKSLAAYMVEAANAVDTDRLRTWLAGRLPDYMIPASFTVLERIPLTPHGKVDRKALPAPAWGASVSTQALPSTPTEQQLADIWQEVLGLEAVGIHDSFFALGGHSLLATQVISRVSQVFGLDVPFHYLFEYPTITGLAVQVDYLLRKQSLLVDADDTEEELEML